MQGKAGLHPRTIRFSKIVHSGGPSDVLDGWPQGVEQSPLVINGCLGRGPYLCLERRGRHWE